MARKKKAQKTSTVARSAGGKDNSKVWSAFSFVAALGGAAVAKKALNAFWKASTGKEPPANPADPEVAMREAVAWAAASGTFIALARMLATRRAASYYARSTGHLPPQLQATSDRGAVLAASLDADR